MPIEFELDESSRIVQSRAWGELTDTELFSHLERVADSFERGAVDSTWGQIADFTEVTNLDGVSSDGLRQLAACNPWPEGSLRVFVVTSDLKYGLARMYQLVGEPRTEGLVLVRSREEAAGCGWSALACRVARDNPESLSALVLVATTHPKSENLASLLQKSTVQTMVWLGVKRFMRIERCFRSTRAGF